MSSIKLRHLRKPRVRPVYDHSPENDGSEWIPHEASRKVWENWFFNLTQSTNPQGTFVVVADFKEGTVSYRVWSQRRLIFWTSEQNIDEWRDLEFALKAERSDDTPPHSKSSGTRIVFLLHEGCKEVDRDAVSLLTKSCNIDPLLLMTHFFWDYTTRIKATPDYAVGMHPLGNNITPVSLPSLINFLALDFAGEQFTVFIPDGIIPKTGTAF